MHARVVVESAPAAAPGQRSRTQEHPMSMPQPNRHLLILSVFLAGSCLAAGAADEPKRAPASEPPDGMQPGLPKGWFGGPFGGGEYQHGIDTKTKKSGEAA